MVQTLPDGYRMASRRRGKRAINFHNFRPNLAGIQVTIMSEFLSRKEREEWTTWREICPICGHVCPLLLPLENGGQTMCAWCARDRGKEAQNAERKAVPERQYERVDTAAPQDRYQQPPEIRPGQRTASHRRLPEYESVHALFDAPYGGYE